MWLSIWSIDQKDVAKVSAVSLRMAIQLKAAGLIGYVPKESLKGYLAGFCGVLNIEAYHRRSWPSAPVRNGAWLCMWRHYKAKNLGGLRSPGSECGPLERS